MVYGGYRVVREVEAAPQKPRWGQEAYKCSGRMQRGRCWDTERGLTERIAHGHATGTLSYSDPSKAAVYAAARVHLAG